MLSNCKETYLKHDQLCEQTEKFLSGNDTKRVWKKQENNKKDRKFYNKISQDIL